MRLSTEVRGSFTIWRDRVPVMHGEATLVTVWEKVGAKHTRLWGGLPEEDMPIALRRQLDRATASG